MQRGSAFSRRQAVLPRNDVGFIADSQSGHYGFRIFKTRDCSGICMQNRRKIEVIYPGVAGQFQQVADGSRLQSGAFPSTRSAINSSFTPGYINLEKNHAGLLHAFQKFLATGGQGQLVIVGPMNEGRRRSSSNSQKNLGLRSESSLPDLWMTSICRPFTRPPCICMSLTVRGIRFHGAGSDGLWSARRLLQCRLVAGGCRTSAAVRQPARIRTNSRKPCIALFLILDARTLLIESGRNILPALPMGKCCSTDTVRISTKL